MKMRVLASLVTGWMLAAGCAGDQTNTFPELDLASNSDGGSNPNVDMSLSDAPAFEGDAANDPGGPTIVVVSPMANEEVHYNTLRVTATITGAMGKLLDADSVKLQLPTGQEGRMVLTSVANTYEGQIDISAIPGGPGKFRVTATDVDMKSSTVEVDYIHDPGATITIVQPAAATAAGVANVEVIFDDKVHPITSVSQVKAGVRAPGDIVLTQIVGAVPFRAQGVVTFQSYVPPLDGDQLLNVESTNSAGTVTRTSKQFTVDQSGPDITIMTPMAGQLVGGILTITATIDDISEVDDSTVIAVIGGFAEYSVNLRRTLPTGKVFSGVFDVRSLGKKYVFPNISVRASDTLGNEGQSAISIIVDNTPPSMTMDPARLRVGRVAAPDVICGRSRDPVGEEAISDGDRVAQVISVHARIEDNGNFAPGQSQEWISTVDPSTVQLFALPTTVPPAAKVSLVVDTDGDGTCDDINPLIVPTPAATTPGQAISVDMVALNAGGSPDYRPTPRVDLPGLNIPANYCNKFGDEGAQQPILCTLGGTEMSYVLPTRFFGSEIQIYSIPPVSSGNPLCAGLQFDTLNRLPEGPACFAIRAKDKVGNRNVTAPIRICIDRGGGLCNNWPLAPSAMPDCTGVFNKMTNTVVASSSCTPAVYGKTDAPYSAVEDLAAMPAVSAVDKCDGVVYGDYCYKLVTTAATWNAAEVACNDWGTAATGRYGTGTLVSMPGQSTAGSAPGAYGDPKQNALIRSIAQGNDVWIGLADNTYYQMFTDGENSELQAWGDGGFPGSGTVIPDGGGSLPPPTECAYMVGSGGDTGRWKEATCNAAKAYICKRSFSHQFPTREPARNTPFILLQ